MDTICRCCLTKYPNIYNIFEDGILEKLRLCANVTISKDDDLPKIVCEICLEKIENSCDFRHTCESSDIFLRDWTAALEKDESIEGETNKIQENSSDNSEESETETNFDDSEMKNTNHIIGYETDLVECLSPEKVELTEPNEQTTCEYKEIEFVSIPYNKEEGFDNQEKKYATMIENVADFNILDDNEVEINPSTTCWRSSKCKDKYNMDVLLEEDQYISKEQNLCNVRVTSDDEIKQEVKKDNGRTLKKRKDRLETKLVACRICNDKFISEELLKEHEKSHTTDGRFRCEHCNKTYSCIPYLTRHLRRHTGVKKHECSICKSRFYDSSSLKIHVRIHTGERPYKCEQCKKSFVQSAQLNAHVKVHSDQKQYECDVCFKRFSYKSLLTTHKKIHLEKKHICPICEKGFILSNQLKMHMERHENPEMKYQCNECGRTFIHNTSLAYHMRTHSGERPYKCTICTKSFLTKTHLRTHYMTHTKVKPPPKVECPYCGKGCYSNSELGVHLRKHTGERPYECTICKKRFLLKVHMSVHMRSHTGEKPYPCTVCNKSFSRLSARKKHMFQHTGEKNFFCNICGKGFAQVGTMNTHQQKAHPSKTKEDPVDQAGTSF